jgi:hypothetical protein
MANYNKLAIQERMEEEVAISAGTAGYDAKGLKDTVTRRAF